MPRDMRKFATQTNVRLILGGLGLLFVVGLGLIALIYGPNAALMGFLCLLGGMVPVGLVALVMFGLDIFVKKNYK